MAQEPLGLVDIPAESHCGHQNRRAATRPLPPISCRSWKPDSEFACQVVQPLRRPSGRRHPVLPSSAYEYLNKFYVEEGNKRVSVLKYYECRSRSRAPSPGWSPPGTTTLENKIYYEFLDFYKLSKVNYVHFSRLGGYSQAADAGLQGHAARAWTDDDRLNFAASLYTMFQSAIRSTWAARPWG